MSLNADIPQKPRHIAPAIHVLATRLAQNTTERVTIGNSPLHILHLCDAQYLAPLFPTCRSLRAVTVHLKYIASSAALETFLRAAATCPTLRDVSVLGGATEMEAAAIAAGLAAFREETEGGKKDNGSGGGGGGADHGAGYFARLTHRGGRGVGGQSLLPLTPPFQGTPPLPRPPRTMRGGRASARPSRASPHYTPYHASPMFTELGQGRGGAAVSSRPLSRAAVSPFSGRRAADVAAAYQTDNTAAMRRGADGKSSGSGRGHPQPQHYYTRRVDPQVGVRRPLSPAIATPPAAGHAKPPPPSHVTSVRRSGVDVHVLLELHRLHEETAATLLAGVRRGTRIASVALQLRVGTTEAKLTGLRLAQHLKQATAQHRQRRHAPQTPIHSAASRSALSCMNTTETQMSRRKGTPGQSGRLGGSGRSSLAAHPPSPAFVVRWQPASPASRRLRTPVPSPPLTRLPHNAAPQSRHAVWPSPWGDVLLRPPRTPAVAPRGPHTPPGARLAHPFLRRPTATAAAAGRAGDSDDDGDREDDAFRRQGRHFFSSERRSAVEMPAQYNAPQPPRLRHGLPSLGAGAAPPSPSDRRRPLSRHGEEAPPPPRSPSRVVPSQKTPHRRSARSLSALTALTSPSLSPPSSSFSPIVLHGAGFRRGRSSSFSSWSSRSTSPQPRRPPSPQLPLPAAAAAMRHGGRQQAAGHLAPAPPASVAQVQRVRQTARETRKVDDTARSGRQGDVPGAVRQAAAPLDLCSSRYCVRRGSDGIRRLLPSQPAADVRLPRRSAEHSAASLRESHGRQASRQAERSVCSCFVCTQQQQQQRQWQGRGEEVRVPSTPRAPERLRRSVREAGGRRGASPRHPEPQLPSPLSSPSIPSSTPSSSSLTQSSPRRPRRPPTPALEEPSQTERATRHNVHVSSHTPRGRWFSEVVKGAEKGRSRGSSDGAYASSASSPGITARTPEKRRRGSAQRAFRRAAFNAVAVAAPQLSASARAPSPREPPGHRSPSHAAASRFESAAPHPDPRTAASDATGSDSSAEHRRGSAACRCVSCTQLPSHHSVSSFLVEQMTSTESSQSAASADHHDGDDEDGYVVYPNSIKFLRARVTEINRHVVWHQVKAAKEAEEHARRLAALESVFAGRVTEQLSDILMVLTDMEHGSRCRR